MPLQLTEDFRRRMVRRMVAPPRDAQDIAETHRMMAKKIQGIPSDVLLVLEAVLMDAETGNRVAQWIWNKETHRLGITGARVFE